MELGGGGWSWGEVGARFSNTHNYIHLSQKFILGWFIFYLNYVKSIHIEKISALPRNLTFSTCESTVTNNTVYCFIE